MSKRRIYEVAKQFKVSSEALVSLLKGLGYEVKSHMSVVDEKMEADIRKKFEQQKEEVKKRDERKREKHQEIALKEETEKGPRKRRRREKKKKAQKAAQKKRRRRRERPAIDKQEVAESVKRTLAQMEGRKPVRRRRRKTDKEKAVAVEEGNVVRVSEFISVAELAEQMDVSPAKVIAKCMELGLLVTINQRLDMDTITMVADEFGYTVEQIEGYVLEEEIEGEELEEEIKLRAPVVTVMGHVDHGKTSLLDYIRKSNIMAGEHGGITQHIGAYEVQLPAGNITFLDTPGHEAFTAMRARGAQVTDIVVLVVAADDNVMPQTVEAIDHARAAGVPIIVAINKIDLPQANPDAIRQQLTQHGITVEEWGGRTIACEISAKTGEGVDKLLEMILLQAEMLELTANYRGKAQGVVVEARLDRGRGPVATVLVQRGTLRSNQSFVTGLCHGKVRTLTNEWGQPISDAGPSRPVQVTGISGVPQSGDPFNVMENDREAREISFKRRQLKREEDFRRASRRLTLKDLYEQIKSGEVKELRLIIKGDVDGSVEAMSDALEKLDVEGVRVQVLHKGVGAVNASDVLLAAASDAIIVGFHVAPDAGARELAAREQVDIRRYNVIYEAVADIESALKGLLEPRFEERILGAAEVRELFNIPRIGTIAGCFVQNGLIRRSASARVVRDGTVVHDGKISSLKRFKNDVSEVQTGFECGIALENFKDFHLNDVLEAYELVEVENR